MSQTEPLDSAMDTGSAAGTPGVHLPDGEDSAIAAGDEIVAAVQDDTPIPPPAAPPASANDPDTPLFREP